MITCKEDLVNTYIENDNGVLRDVYVSLCRLHGVKWAEGQDADKHQNIEQFLMVDADGDIGTRNNESFFLIPRPNIKQLTLSDLLPTTYENTKVYSLDEDVIRKYAELCGVKYDYDAEDRKRYKCMGASWIDQIRCAVREFTDASDVHSGKYPTTTLTPEQILAAWDLKLKKSWTKESSAIETLQGLDYEWKGGELWQPPLGDVPSYIKPKTRTEYVKAEGSHNDIASMMIDGAIFYNEDGTSSYSWSGHRFEANNGGRIEIRGEFYRRTEKEVTWQDEINQFFNDTIALGIDHDFESAINSDSLRGEFIEMCHLVASLTDNPNK